MAERQPSRAGAGQLLFGCGHIITVGYGPGGHRPLETCRNCLRATAELGRTDVILMAHHRPITFTRRRPFSS